MRVILLFVVATAWAQGQPGSLTGVITNPDGAGVPTIPIQVKNAATGVVFEATTTPAGRYTISGVPPGSYEVLVPAVGFTLEKFERKDVVVAAAETLNLDVQLKWSDNLGTPGDDPSIFLRTKYANAAGKTPRTRDGKPDLSGVWNGNDDPNPKDPEALPWAEARAKRNRETRFRESPSTQCLPSSVPPMGPLLWRLVQTPSLLIMLFEDIPGYRQIYLDGRPHPPDLNPSWLGHSVGKWEGETLVVDTVGLNDKGWIGAYPHTEKLHLIERYRRPDLAHLEVEIVAEDPGAYLKPWTIRAVWNLAPGEEILEYVCTENSKDGPHLLDN